MGGLTTAGAPGTTGPGAAAEAATVGLVAEAFASAAGATILVAGLGAGDDVDIAASGWSRFATTARRRGVVSRSGLTFARVESDGAAGAESASVDALGVDVRLDNLGGTGGFNRTTFGVSAVDRSGAAKGCVADAGVGVSFLPG
ncbi:MAG: hypothetical protein QOH60_2666 [Mycobacterium sp.]|nr:hypothetical protein [Mycobacterium sp.]